MNATNTNLIRAIRGPLVLITIGTLFAFDHFTEFSLWRTWPTLLIVLGILSLAERFAVNTAPVAPYPQYTPPQYTPPSPPPPAEGPQGGM